MAKVLIWRTRSAPSPTDSLNAAAACFLQVAEWLTWASTELSPLMDDKLVKAAATAAPGAADAKGAAPAAGKDKEGGKEGKKKDAGAAAAAPAAKKEGGGAAKKEEEEASIDMLDCRVGRIVKIDKHPNADSLYLEEIDVGEDKPRQVISGLRNFVPVEKMQDRVVVVVCNLKPAKMRDVMSYGMVLCASDDAHGTVDPVNVPEGVPVGERLTVEGGCAHLQGEALPDQQGAAHLHRAQWLGQVERVRVVALVWALAWAGHTPGPEYLRRLQGWPVSPIGAQAACFCCDNVPTADCRGDVAH
eukprot:XP_001695605.1 predicted protein [Chlamydomonas reinhardtii]